MTSLNSLDFCLVKLNEKRKFEEESLISGTTQETLRYRLFCSLISDCLRNGWSVQSGLQGFSFEAPTLTKEDAKRLSKENALEARDIAELVYFLCQSSQYINFTDINVDPIKKVVLRK